MSIKAGRGPTDFFSSLSPVLSNLEVHSTSIVKRMLIAVSYALDRAALPYSGSCPSVIAKQLLTLLNDHRSDEDEARES